MKKRPPRRYALYPESALLLTLALILSLAACVGVSGENQPVSGEIRVYRVVKEDGRITGEILHAETLRYSDLSLAPQTAAEALAAAPDNSSLMSALPEGVEIISVRLNGRTVDVRMSTGYDKLSGAKKTLLDSCLTLTMCSIPDVDYVSIHAENRPAGGHLSSEDIVLSNTLLNAGAVKIRLYFPRADFRVLAAEYRAVNMNEDFSAERIVINELLRGPDSEGLLAALPRDTVLLSVYTQDGICTVNFAEELLELGTRDADSIRLAVYSLVNSLTCLKDVEGVMIVIQNNPEKRIGDLDLSEPLGRKTSIIGAAVIG